MRSWALLLLRKLTVHLSRRGLLLLCTCVSVFLLLHLFSYARTQTFSTKGKFVPDSRWGSVFSVLVYEQMGNAAANLMNLQCWAGSFKMAVVEPSIRESSIIGDQIFQFNEDYSGERFRDLFDIERWNSYSSTKNYSPLVSMETFLNKASRNVILVELIYSGSLKCSQGLTRSLTNIIPSLIQFGRRFFLSYPHSFFSSHDFKIVREVCIDLLHEGRLRTQQEFKELIFGELLGQGNFTVVFDEWRAIRNESEREGKLESVDITSELHRILIRDSPCTYSSLNLEPYHKSWIRLPSQNSTLDKSDPTDVDTSVLKKGLLGFIPSDQVLAHAAEYRDKYMSNKPYTAIMLRMENLQSGIKEKARYQKCIEKVKTYWEYSRVNYQVNQVFLSSDVGKYGSKTMERYDSTLSLEFQKDLVDTLGVASLHSQMSTMIEKLEEITHSTGRVRIAWTQSAIVAQARCIILIGGGSFQGLVLNMHSSLYREKECFVFLDTYCVDYAKAGFV